MDAAAYRMCFDEDKLAILCAQYDRRLDSIGTENAKLRELVREMYAAIDMADHVHDFDDPMHLMFVDDMRELGIEVDG